MSAVTAIIFRWSKISLHSCVRCNGSHLDSRSRRSYLDVLGFAAISATAEILPPGISEIILLVERERYCAMFVSGVLLTAVKTSSLKIPHFQSFSLSKIAWKFFGSEKCVCMYWVFFVFAVFSACVNEVCAGRLFFKWQLDLSPPPCKMHKEATLLESLVLIKLILPCQRTREEVAL